MFWMAWIGMLTATILSANGCVAVLGRHMSVMRTVWFGLILESCSTRCHSVILIAGVLYCSKA